MNFRTAALAASALTIALVLAGCSATTTTTMPSDMPGMPGMDSPSNAAPQFNDSDIAFVMQMIPHHQQAVEMADILLDKTDVDSRVVELATQVKAAQGPEITTMTSWL